MEALDLTQVPVVDNHCHGLLRDQAFEDIASWRQAFTESTDPGMPRDHVASTALYRRLIRMLASFLGCEPEEEAVFAARIGRDGRELTGALLRAANVDTLLLDTGFPPPEEVVPVPELGKLASCRTESMLRLEILMEGLLAEHDSLEDVKEALGVAPSSKLMYSSDGIGVPELHWISAIDGRRAIGEALGELVSQGELDLVVAEATGEDVLRANATRLYRL